MLIDEARGRIFFGTAGGFGILGPSPRVDTAELYLTAASSRPLPVRSLADRADPGRDVEQRHARFQQRDAHAQRSTKPCFPTAGSRVFSEARADLGTPRDDVRAERRRRNRHGPLERPRRHPIFSDQLADTFAWSRTSVPAPGGGTLGYAANAVTGAFALGVGHTGFVFASPDPSRQTNAGLLVIVPSTGTISIIDATGVTRATYAFDWPGGYRVQGTSIFDAFALPASPIGAHLLHGRDRAGPPLRLRVGRDERRLGGPRSHRSLLLRDGAQVAGYTSGGGVTPTLQIFNPGTSPANVSVSMRIAQPVYGPRRPGPAARLTSVVAARSGRHPRRRQRLGPRP